MPDIIHLLPDNIANQIAAGEVIQRPASAVKELLENAVDAGATEIKLLVNDAGKALIQVIDNGKGMSETDARLSFERHATSKIRSIDDLFHIRTMGFRGEALASIAAVAQVELKSKRAEDTVGTYIEIENSVVKKQEPVAVPEGTSFSMKNLFFNVPARRNFLKSNAAELRHILEEFIRVAMAFPEIFFSLSSNGQQVFHLERGSLKQRIVQLLGNTYQSKLVTVNEKTDYLDIVGFVGKPETAKKTRGDQYLFVNNRFIKSPYLNHAIMRAFDNLIAKDSFPMYALFITLDPAQVDINVHPTKQEIKFEDERIVYAFVESAVKHALAQFSITPTLDFELDPEIEKLDAVSKPATEAGSNAGTAALFRSFGEKGRAHYIENKSELRNWKDLYPEANKPVRHEQPYADPLAKSISEPLTTNSTQPDTENQQQQFQPLQVPVQEELSSGPMLQLHQTYIVVQNASGYLLVHQQNAHERVLYERFEKAMEGKPIAVQQSLFPATINTSAADAIIINSLLDDLKLLGYILEPFGQNTFVIQGTPADVDQGNESRALELILEQYKHFSADIKFSKREKLIRTLAIQQSIKAGKPLSQKEMQGLISELVECKTPAATPNGKPVFFTFSKSELDKMFGR